MFNQSEESIYSLLCSLSIPTPPLPLSPTSRFYFFTSQVEPIKCTHDQTTLNENPDIVPMVVPIQGLNRGNMFIYRASWKPLQNWARGNYIYKDLKERNILFLHTSQSHLLCLDEYWVSISMPCPHPHPGEMSLLRGLLLPGPVVFHTMWTFPPTDQSWLNWVGAYCLTPSAGYWPTIQGCYWKISWASNMPASEIWTKKHE